MLLASMARSDGGVARDRRWSATSEISNTPIINSTSKQQLQQATVGVANREQAIETAPYNQAPSLVSTRGSRFVGLHSNAARALWPQQVTLEEPERGT
jgi:hypothetical protein